MSDIYPSQHYDVHAHVNKHDGRFNWFVDGRNMMPMQLYGMYFTLAVLFVPMISVGQSIMKNREPYCLKYPLFLWNACMSIMSGIGAYYTCSYLVHAIMEWETMNVVCDHETVYTSDIAWYIVVFNATKILEWIDTVFLVLRKKKIIFLHWFHHLVTYLYCYHGTYYSYRSDASGLWFCSMNLFVHAIMYGYYAWVTLGFTFRLNYLITSIQLMQMVIGTTISLMTIQCPDIARNYHGFAFAMTMYMIYGYLFYQIFTQKRITHIKKN